MIEELRSLFGADAVVRAKARLVRARGAVEMPDGFEVVGAELHALAGELAMLGYYEITSAAHAGELAADRWGGGEGDAQAECAATLRALVEQLDSIELSAPPAAQPVESSAGNEAPSGD